VKCTQTHFTTSEAIHSSVHTHTYKFMMLKQFVVFMYDICVFHWDIPIRQENNSHYICIYMCVCVCVCVCVCSNLFHWGCLVIVIPWRPVAVPIIYTDNKTYKDGVLSKGSPEDIFNVRHVYTIDNHIRS